MGTKLPSSVASDDQHGDNLGKQSALLEKYAWQQDRGVQFNLTASILRYTFTGGNAYIHDRGTQTQVTGLDDLACTVDNFTTDLAKKFGGIAEAGDKLFVFYDVEVVSSDRISYSGDIYEPISVWYNAESGRCEVQSRLVAVL